MQSVQRYRVINLDSAINEWVATTDTTHSHSKKTEKAYRDTINAFRDFLTNEGYDLLPGYGRDFDINDVVRIATLWANMRFPARIKKDATVSTRFHSEVPVSSSTYNQRLAILSSFYTFLKTQYKLDIPNPIEAIKKPKVQAYAAAIPLDVDETVIGLEKIDRSTPEGMRDYALLCIALHTGRRASELVGLRWEHVKITGKGKDQKVTLTFVHCKGNKVMRDTLNSEASAIFIEYLHIQYGKNLKLANDAPIWVSYSRNNKGQAIGTRTLSNICQKHLDTTKTHALRHTFSVGMMKSNAPITELADRLGHTDIKITQLYAKEIRGDENPYSEKLTSRFGFHRKAK